MPPTLEAAAVLTWVNAGSPWRAEAGSEEKESIMFMTTEDLVPIALIGLILVLRNWWELIECGFERRATPAEALPVIPPHAAIAAPALARFGVARAGRTAQRLLRRRPTARSIRPGHQPVKHHG